MVGWVLHSSKSILPRAFFVVGRCKGLSAEGGNPAQYKAGGLLIRGNTIERVAQWKRTYQPPISFSGCGNVFEENKVGHVPHTCITGVGVNMTFRDNTIDTCAYESSDVGAFCACPAHIDTQSHSLQWPCAPCAPCHAWPLE